MQSTYNSGQYLENAPEVLAIITINDHPHIEGTQPVSYYILP